MNKGLIWLAGIALIVAGSVSWFFSANNQFVTLQENVNSQWSQVENVYQRRADLIPNLVNTVKGYAKHEAGVLEEVTKARAQVGQVHVNGPQDVAKFDQAQGQLSSALSRLLVVSERYPELKADKSFGELQSELEERLENRIAVERRRFNETARDYNIAVRQFPRSFVAQMRGFQEKPYFAADSGAKTAPKVEF